MTHTKKEIRDQRPPDQPESAKHDGVVIIDELVIQLIRKQLGRLAAFHP